MEYKVETSLYDFPAWSGGKDTLETLIERDDWEAVEDLIETVFFDQDATDEDINDFLWFERDTIAEHLGYSDWEAYENGDAPEYEDMNGTPIQIDDIVYWHDEAGVQEDGSMIEFIVDEANGNGYFCIHTVEESFADRWAWHEELEVKE